MRYLLLTATRSRYAGGDAGELVAETCYMEPHIHQDIKLFSMLTSVSTKLLPFQPAVSANLMSAFFGAWAGVFIFKSVVTFTTSTTPIAYLGKSWAA